MLLRCLGPFSFLGAMLHCLASKCPWCYMSVETPALDTLPPAIIILHISDCKAVKDKARFDEKFCFRIRKLLQLRPHETRRGARIADGTLFV